MNKNNKNRNDMPHDTNNNVDALLDFIPYFSNTENEFSVFVVPETAADPKTGEHASQFPRYRDAPEVVRFRHILVASGMIVAFDWPNWGEAAKQYFDDTKCIEAADLETIKKLFTVCLRADRFNEGYFARMVREGVMLKLLVRLREIRDGRTLETKIGGM